MLDKITPDSFKKVYEIILEKLRDIGILDRFNFKDEYMLVALDGTHYHSSKNYNVLRCQDHLTKFSYSTKLRYFL